MGLVVRNCGSVAQQSQGGALVIAEGASITVRGMQV